MLRSTFKLAMGVVSFWPFLPVAQRAPIYARLVAELLADRRVPWSRKALLVFAAAYVATPIDLIPDFLPFVSRVDDMAVVVIALDLFFEGVPRELMMEKLYALDIDGRELERDMEAARRLLPRPVMAAARRLPDLLETSAGVIMGELEARGVLDKIRLRREADFE